MIRSIRRIPRKYLRRQVWRRWWRSADRELARREWRWFWMSYLGRIPARLLFGGLILFYALYPWIQDHLRIFIQRMPIPANIGIPRYIGYNAVQNIVMSLPIVLLIVDVISRRARLHLHADHLPHILLSRLHLRDIWPAILLAPVFVLSLINALAITSTIGGMTYEMFKDYGEYGVVLAWRQQLPTVVLYPFWFVFNIVESVAILFVVIQINGGRHSRFRLFLLYLGIMLLNILLFFSFQHLWFRYLVFNNSWFKFAGDNAILLRNFMELFLLIVFSLVGYLLVIRWTVRRLRGESMRRRVIARLSQGF